MQPEAGRRRVIVADDDPTLLALLARQLSAAGYDVVSCADGVQALDAVQRMGTGVVLADWNMPNIDGLGLCRRIRELSADDAIGFVYFILLSANSHTNRIVEGFEAGVDDYLTKPYHKEELLARMRAGERICDLQRQVTERRIELQRANARLASLNQKLHRLATTDELTGLANRRQTLAQVNEQWARAVRHNRALSCLMVDVDHFKSVNDTHGHEVGDAALRHVAALLRDATRTGDTVGRFGGEEFLVIAPETDLNGARQLAERIRERISATPLPAPTLHITVSIGVAALEPRLNDPHQMLAAADAALYAAKAAGRNRVAAAGDAGTPHHPVPTSVP